MYKMNFLTCSFVKNNISLIFRFVQINQSTLVSEQLQLLYREPPQISQIQLIFSNLEC